MLDPTDPRIPHEPGEFKACVFTACKWEMKVADLQSVQGGFQMPQEEIERRIVEHLQTHQVLITHLFEAITMGVIHEH